MDAVEIHVQRYERGKYAYVQPAPRVSSQQSVLLQQVELSGL